MFLIADSAAIFCADNHVVKDYIVSSSYILLLTDLGHIICYDFYMGSLKGKLILILMIQFLFLEIMGLFWLLKVDR